MDLPHDSLGISDALAYRECPRRFSYGMKRHTGIGMQSDDATPEAGSYATWYGTAIHEVIHSVEDGFTEDEAIQRAWDECGPYLEPADLDQLREDLAVYRERDFPNTRLIANEDEFRVPLFVHEGRQVYFRFKLDRLYERLDEPGTLIHVDYKSSRHAKTQKEIDEDLQLWAYWFGIREFFPEYDHVQQVYEQLKFGQLYPRRRGPRAHEQMREFLIRVARSVLEDDEVRPDGLLRPRKNDWCAYCPIMESCPIILELSDFALAEIAALAPQRPKIKADGKPGKLMEDVPLDPSRIEEYAERYDQAREAAKVLERFTDSVGTLLKRMPDSERVNLGYKSTSRKVRTMPQHALKQLHERLGPDFYSVISTSQARLEEALADDPELLDYVKRELMVQVETRPTLKRAS